MAARMTYGMAIVASLVVALVASVARADTPSVAHPPPSTGPEDWVKLYSGIAKMHGVAVTDAEVRSALADDTNEIAFQAFENKIQAPLVNAPYAALYLADIDNDGANEYVLSRRNPVGGHNDDIVGVFRPQRGGALLEVPIPAIGPSRLGPTFHASPFLSMDREGVTMRFIEDAGHFQLPEDARLARYLWKANTVRLLDRLPIPRTPPPSSVRTIPPMKCAVTTPSGDFVASFEYATMNGTVTADGAVGTRRFNVRAAPYNGTYNLVFQSYGTEDRKPPSESLTRMTSVVARLVAYGEASHLFLDGDYHPSVRAPMDGFLCQ
jgi:hypothetical protein